MNSMVPQGMMIVMGIWWLIMLVVVILVVSALRRTAAATEQIADALVALQQRQSPGFTDSAT